MSIATAPTKQHKTGTSSTVTLVQNYSKIMENILYSGKFPVLSTANDILYIMMATLDLESSFKILHKVKQESGSVVISSTHGAGAKITVGIGKSYWTDPVILPLRDSSDPQIKTNVAEGLYPHALMGSMGMYQVRNCRESTVIMSGGGYLAYAESLGLMVNPGQSISTIFPNDDTGATRSMTMGCIIMEWHYKQRLKKYDKNTAIQKAVGSYVGIDGAKDILGTSPAMRISMVNDLNSGVAKKLAAAGIVKGQVGKVYSGPPTTQTAQTETKNTVAATGPGNVATNTKGCNRA